MTGAGRAGSGSAHGPIRYYGPGVGRPSENGEFAFCFDDRYWRCRSCGTWTLDRTDAKPKCSECGRPRPKNWSAPAP